MLYFSGISKIPRTALLFIVSEIWQLYEYLMLRKTFPYNYKNMEWFRHSFTFTGNKFVKSEGTIIRRKRRD